MMIVEGKQLPPHKTSQRNGQIELCKYETGEVLYGVLTETNILVNGSEAHEMNRNVSRG